jgi:hypothetical protein
MTYISDITNSFLVIACGLDAEQHIWPFGRGPKLTDVRAGISDQYRDWRSARGLPLEKPSAKKASTTTTTTTKKDNSFINVDDMPNRY